MNTHETDKIFSDYNSGEKNMEQVNEALKDMNAGFHLEPLTDEERAAKNDRENIAGTVYNPNPDPVLPDELDRRRRKDLIGAPKSEREIVQKTKHGKFLVEYDIDGYMVSAKKI